MIQILLLAFVPLALAQYGGKGDSEKGKIEEHYPPQPYKFGYDIKDHHGSTIQQKEVGDDHGNKQGSYGYTDGHGIYRMVEYIADKDGFRAVIKTNEPGTSDEDPADVKIESDAPKVEYKEEPRSYKKSEEESKYRQSSRDEYKSEDNSGYKQSSRDEQDDKTKQILYKLFEESSKYNSEPKLYKEQSYSEPSTRSYTYLSESPSKRSDESPTYTFISLSNLLKGYQTA